MTKTATDDGSEPHQHDISQKVKQLSEDGYVVLPSLVTPALLDQVRHELAPHLQQGFPGRNEFEGKHTKRVYALLAKAPSVAHLVAHPLLLAMVGRVLEPGFLLSANLAISLGPGETAQPWHHDDAFYPFERPRPPIAASAIWALDDFTEVNGATEVIPGSHQWGPNQPGDDQAFLNITMPAGSVLVFLGTLWHRGGTNRSNADRLAITPQYCQPWARQQEQMVLAVPPPVAATLSADVQQLLGYNIRPPFMGHVNGMHPQRLVDPHYRAGDHDHRALGSRLLEGDGSATAIPPLDARLRHNRTAGSPTK